MRVIWIKKKGSDIRMVKSNPQIPESFNSPEEAGDFWDTHSAADYPDDLESVEMEFDIKKKIFLIPVEEKVFRLARNQARKKHCSVEQVVNKLLKHDLVATKS